MNLDKFKGVTTTVTPPEVKNQKYVDRLAELYPKKSGRRILPMLGTIAAALIVTVAVTLWALIGRGVRSQRPQDDVIVPPADKTAQDTPQVSHKEPLPTASALIGTEYITYTDDEYKKLCDIYSGYLIPALPEFLVGEVPTRDEMTEYAKAVRPSLFDDGILSAEELNTLAYEVFGIMTEYGDDTAYKDGIEEKAYELFDTPAVRCFATAKTDTGKMSVTVGYSEPDDDYREFIKNKIEYITYVTDGDAFTPLYVIEHRVADGVSTLDNVHGVADKTVKNIPLTDENTAEYLEFIKENAILSLPKFERGNMPDAADTLRYLLAIGKNPQSASQMNTLVQTYLGHQGMVSSLPAIPETAMIYDYKSVWILSAKSYESTVDGTPCTRLVYHYNNELYAVEYTKDGCFISHTAADDLTVRIERWQGDSSAYGKTVDGEALYKLLDSLTYTDGNCACKGGVMAFFSNGAEYRLILGTEGEMAHVVCSLGVCRIDATLRDTLTELINVKGGSNFVINSDGTTYADSVAVTKNGKKYTLLHSDVSDAVRLISAKDYGDGFCDCGSTAVSFEIDGAGYSMCGCESPRLHGPCGGRILTQNEYNMIIAFINRIE